MIVAMLKSSEEVFEPLLIKIAVDSRLAAKVPALKWSQENSEKNTYLTTLLPRNFSPVFTVFC